MSGRCSSGARWPSPPSSPGDARHSWIVRSISYSQHSQDRTRPYSRTPWSGPSLPASGGREGTGCNRVQAEVDLRLLSLDLPVVDAVRRSDGVGLADEDGTAEELVGLSSFV